MLARDLFKLARRIGKDVQLAGVRMAAFGTRIVLAMMNAKALRFLGGKGGYAGSKDG